MSDNASRAETAAGLALGGAVLAGLAGLLVGFFSAISNNLVAAGLGFIASAIAFGLILNAVFRH